MSEEPTIFIVTNGDQVFCEACYEEQIVELDGATFAYKVKDTGTCEGCGASVQGEVV